MSTTSHREGRQRVEWGKGRVTYLTVTAKVKAGKAPLSALATTVQSGRWSNQSFLMRATASAVNIVVSRLDYFIVIVTVMVNDTTY